MELEKAEDVVRTDLGRLNEIEPGLGNRTIAYVLGEVDEVPHLPVAAETVLDLQYYDPMTNLAILASSAIDPLNTAHTTLAGFLGGSNPPQGAPTRDRLRLFGQALMPHDVLVRYGRVLAAATPSHHGAGSHGDPANLNGSGHVPFDLRVIFTTIRLGLVDTTPNERHATYDTAPSPETALAICQAAGGDLVDLFDILFTGREGTGNMANQLGMLLKVIDPVALAQAHPDDLLAATQRMDDLGRIAVLDKLRRWELFGHQGLRNLGFQLLEAYPQERALERRLARMPVEAALAEAPARLASKKAADRGLMIRLLVAHVQDKDVQDVLRAHRDSEKSKTNIAIIDSALRTEDRKAKDVVSTEKQGHGYRAIDGSWVEAPEIPLKEVMSFMRRLEDTLYLGGGHHQWGKLDPEELWQKAANNLERVKRWLNESAISARAAFRVLEAFPKTPDKLLESLEKRARRLTPRELSKGARALLQDLPGLSDQLLGELTDSSAAKRATAASWLGDMGDLAAIAPIKARLAKEKDANAQTAMLTTLSVLGADMTPYLGPEALAAAAAKGAKKAKLKSVESLLADTSLPDVTYRDGTPVPEDVLTAWITAAVRLKQPEGHPLMDLYLDQLAEPDAARLSTWSLKTWIAFDTCLAQRIAQDLVGSTINDGRGTSGILALATRTPPAQAAIAVRGYLRDHGKRYQQGRALLKLMAAIGQPETLQVLAVAAARQKQASLRNLAGELLTEVAEAHGWTIEELEDRTVPHLGLDAEGTLDLSIGGGKSYRAQLGDDLAFHLTNPAGKAVKSLPAGQDEATKTAKKTLADAKKELKQIAKAQAQRLYEAMCSERSWTVADWQRHYRDHPVMARLAQRVIWLGLDTDGAVTGSFRLTAEGDLTDVADEAVDLQGCERVQIAHGSKLPEADGSGWGQHMADYEVEPLFRQFGRPVLDAPDATGTAFEDRMGWDTEAGMLRKTANTLGYTAGPIDDYPHFSTFVKPFVGAGLVAVIHHSGTSSTGDDAGAEVTLGHLEFCELVGGQPGDAKEIATIPPVLLMECWNDYRDIAATGEPNPKGLRR